MPSQDNPVEEALFRRTMGRFATGVTIVTSAHGGDIAGTTVSAFSSLSIRPPLVAVCLDETSATRRLIDGSRVFAVNVLAQDQEALSERFATSRSEGEPHQFDGVSYREAVTGSPILQGCHAFADCRVVAAHEGGDHRIYVGRVQSLGAEDDGSRPLVYHGGRYRRLKD
jgi:3-hydroxy-9,10-secoandrosta-1,3,5(10)-triene-9,17-dione monooxygenase reductase component